MADTIFNIFGDHLSNPVHRQLLRVQKSDENASVGKPGLSSVHTPAKKNMNSMTPRHTDSKKKSFLQNKGTPIQLCSTGDYRRNALQSIQKNNLQIYEDNPLPLKADLTPEDLIKIEYTRNPNIDDDPYLSDSDMVMSDEHINNLVLDLPGVDLNVDPPAYSRFQMDQPLVHLNLDDVLIDDLCGSLEDDMDLNISDGDIPIPF